MTRELKVEYRPATVAVRVTADGGDGMCADGGRFRTTRPPRHCVQRRRPAHALPRAVRGGAIRALQVADAADGSPGGAALTGDARLGSDTAPLSVVPPVSELGQAGTGAGVARRPGARHPHPDGAGRRRQFRRRRFARVQPRRLQRDSRRPHRSADLQEAQKLVRLASWEITERWHGVYGMPKDAELYRETIDGAIHLVTGIRGKGMTTGPAVARDDCGAVSTPRKQVRIIRTCLRGVLVLTPSSPRISCNTPRPCRP